MAEAPTQLQLASEPESSSVTPNTHDTAPNQNQPQIHSSAPNHHQPSPPVSHTEPQASSLSPSLAAILTDVPVSAPSPSSFTQAQHALPAEAPVLPAPAVPELAQALAPPSETTYPPPSDDPSLQNPTSAELPPTSLPADLAEHTVVDDSLHHNALADNTTSPTATLSADPPTTNGHISDHQQEPRQQISGTDMSNPSYPPDPHRQSPSYGVQAQYPMPAMNNSYGYPATGQRNDVYPSHPNSSNNSVPLPSMRTFESVRPQHQQHHQQPQQPQQPVMASPMPTTGSSVPSSVPYYQSLGNGSSYGLPPDLGGPRYQLPSDPRGILGGNRHKKEIKRRTKTGCLTCRKRRIKCDEAHPTCKNCQKSKRECLGYDPIFKQQQQHPSTIQPAANNLSTSPQSSHHSIASPTSNNFTPVTALGQPIEAPMVPSAYPLQPSRKMKVEELVAMGGALPPSTDLPLTENEVMEIRELYDTVYSPGLESFFETSWYTSHAGISAFLSNKSLHQTMSCFLRAIAKEDEAGQQYSANLEFRVVWDVAKLVKTADSQINTGPMLPLPDNGSEARNRLGVIEVLLAGACLDQNPLMPPPINCDPSSGDYNRVREFRFWYYLGEFLRVRDQPGVNMTPHRDHVLSILREVLDGRENRDVLYSFAIMRAYSPNFPADFENSLPPHLDETDPKSKLAVARKFVANESLVPGGTTNVVRRFSELALRAFVAPGHNITRQ